MDIDMEMDMDIDIDMEMDMDMEMKNILVVDDNPLFLEMCLELFSELGYNIKTANDGQKAWELFQKSPDKYLFITTDQDMPILTGEEFILKLRQHGFQIPVVLISGNLNHVAKSTAELKNVYFLTKPFTMEEIDSVFNKCRCYSMV